ncbi:MAG: glycosyltransferase [Acidimicrobiales bacterium]|nr:glycosyltransferase [Acidimicrobiales bacterium]
MRTLVIAGDYPWPEVIGPRIRLSMVLRALRACGPVELLSVVSQFRTDVDPPDPALGLDQVTCVGFDNRPPRGLGVLRSLVQPDLPLSLPVGGRDVAAGALVRAAHGHYDLVWVFGARPWVLCGQPHLAPTVLDLDDLEDEKIAARLAVPAASRGPADRLRRLGSEIVGHEEMRRWRRLHRRADELADAVAVCSPLDAARAQARGVLGATVVRNGYPVVDAPLGRPTVSSPPTILFQGLLRYPANVEAAVWLARDVLPRLRARVPDVRLRLVGEPAPAVEALDDPPTVSVVGRVPDMAPELARADLVVVPVRYGSGTRIKIIEAFAHHIPVASTTVGAEGLDVTDGVHLLVGDTADELAGAAARLLSDEALRAGLTESAAALYRTRYSSPVIEAEIGALARRVAAGERP